jgi:hypothetical protein
MALPTCGFSTKAICASCASFADVFPLIHDAILRTLVAYFR